MFTSMKKHVTKCSHVFSVFRQQRNNRGQGVATALQTFNASIMQLKLQQALATQVILVSSVISLLALLLLWDLLIMRKIQNITTAIIPKRFFNNLCYLTCVFVVGSLRFEIKMHIIQKTWCSEDFHYAQKHEFIFELNIICLQRHLGCL